MDQDCKHLSEKLDKLVRIVALSVVVDRPRQEQCELLSSAGLKPAEIAQILGTTPNTVSVALSTLKKQRQEAKGGKK